MKRPLTIAVDKLMRKWLTAHAIRTATRRQTREWRRRATIVVQGGCVSPNGRVDCHNHYIMTEAKSGKLVCSFCKRPL